MDISKFDVIKFKRLTRSVFEESENENEWFVQCGLLNLLIDLSNFSDFSEDIKLLERELNDFLFLKDESEDLPAKTLKLIIESIKKKREAWTNETSDLDQMNKIMFNTKIEEPIFREPNIFSDSEMNICPVRNEINLETREENLLSERNEISLHSFVRDCNLKNKFKISCALVDGKGNFVIYDKLARDSVFECKKINNISLFDLMIPLSVRLLNKKYGECVFKKSNEMKICSYTIYSENAKKKYRKSINKKNYEEQKLGETKGNDEENPGIDIFYKYLKCLTSRITKVRLNINRAVLEKLPMKGSLLYNRSNPLVEEVLKSDEDKEFTLILLETRNSKHIQRFNYEYMRNDKKIQNFEEKIKRKKLKLDSDHDKYISTRNNPQPSYNEENAEFSFEG